MAGEWEAIDEWSVMDCVTSPCSQISDIPDALRPDWARALSDVFVQLRTARAAGDAFGEERAFKSYLALHVSRAAPRAAPWDSRLLQADDGPGGAL